ncbi:MAG: DUF2147 domain-containing protein [Flavobacterium sp.]|nr:DUF2147 domain-containing protein [Flavobacterium sp.]
MKKLFILIIATVFFTQLMAQDQIVGKWWTPRKDGQIEIYKLGTKYFGKLIWGKDGTKKDVKNPKEELRSRLLTGMDLFTNFSYNASDAQWIDGKIYDPQGGKTYNCKIWLTNDGKTLNARGFIGFSLLGRTEKFTRL